MRLLALPMHGETKLRNEGLRTRDAHLLEWISRLEPQWSVTLRSRPEPWPRVRLARRGDGAVLPPNWTLVSPQPMAIPPVLAPRRWWVKSVQYEPRWPAHDYSIAWNPLAAAAYSRQSGMCLGLFDLLDDWSVHHAFAGLQDEIEEAYARVFGSASVVTANSEGTLNLAHRFGRSDAILISNGCDPERFDRDRELQPAVTVGYGGKIGARLDVDLIADVAKANPLLSFEFAGPVLVGQVGRALRRINNVALLGDVRYDRYPAVLRRWDLAWVPHLVGQGEVGGDAIKIYEYRAAGIPVVTTKIIGWDRAPKGVLVKDRAGVAPTIRALSERMDRTGRLERDVYVTPREHTWRHKASQMIALLAGRARAPRA